MRELKQGGVVTELVNLCPTGLKEMYMCRRHLSCTAGLLVLMKFTVHV